MRVQPNHIAVPVVLAAYLFFGVDASAYARQPQDSSHIVAFGDKASDEPAAPAPAPDLEVQPARVAIGRLVPPPPRLKSSVGAGQSHFMSRPAVASQWTLNSPFGVRQDPISGLIRIHTGIDLHGTFGESVGASMSGTVVFAGERSGYGNLVVIDHGSGLATYYAHLSGFAVSTGSPVEAGQVLGYVGTTGHSTGPHLHYEVRVYGHPLDPATQIVMDGERLSVGGQVVVPGQVGGSSLPKASESTTISVDWADPGMDLTDAAGHALQVDWE